MSSISFPRAEAASSGVVLGLVVLLGPLAAMVDANDAPLFAPAASALGLGGERAVRVHFADLDGDGDPDLILDRTRVFVNHENGEARRFVRRESVDSPFNTEWIRRAGLIQSGDFNGDGRLDLYLGRSSDLSNAKFVDDGLRSEIWLQGEDGRFTEVERSGVEAHAETLITALVVDYDRDGILDLFTGSAYTAYGKSLEAFPDRLYRGRGDGTFEDVTERAGLLGVAQWGKRDSRKPSYGVAHTDWNNDGLQDLLVMTYGRQWNKLWENQGDGTFKDVGAATTFDGDAIRDGSYPPGIGRQGEAPFRSNGNSFDFAIADVDGDGDMDGFLGEITHWWAGASSDRSMMLWNEGPAKGFRFRRAPGAIPARPHAGARWNQGDLHAGWVDLDNDGRLDLLLACSDYPDDQVLRVYHQEAGGAFTDWTDRLGFRWINASQISLGDFDRDGAVDLAVGTSNTRLTKEQRASRPLDVGLFRNLAAARAGNSFFSLRLAGRGVGRANPLAVGARVTIWIDGAQQTREVYGGQGSSGHRDDTELCFGVGKAETIDKVVVRWPDAAATTQVFEAVATGRFYRLREGDALERVQARD